MNRMQIKGDGGEVRVICFTLVGLGEVGVDRNKSEPLLPNQTKKKKTELERKYQVATTM